MKNATNRGKVKKSELSAEGTKRDVENTPKFTRPDCILAKRSSLRPPPDADDAAAADADDDDDDGYVHNTNKRIEVMKQVKAWKVWRNLHTTLCGELWWW